MLSLVKCSVDRVSPALKRGWVHEVTVSCLYVRVDEETSKTGGSVKVVRLRTQVITKTFEDPATGSAASGLSSLFPLNAKDRRVKYEIIQGVKMGRQ